MALMKLGAVISPVTILLAEADMRDRFERGHIGHAIVDASLTGRFVNLAGNYTSIAVGRGAGPETFVPDGEAHATDHEAVEKAAVVASPDAQPWSCQPRSSFW